MTNHYLKALTILEDNLPDIARELDQHADIKDTGRREDMGTAKEAKEFALGIIDELRARLKEIREEIEAMPLKDF